MNSGLYITSISLKNGIATIKNVVAEMPAKPGVYKMIGERDKILYIGKAKNLPKRIISYSKIGALPNRLKRMVSQIVRIEYMTTANESEALLLEASLIKSLNPYFNIALKDDKSFPYIMFDDTHKYPRISKHRGKLKKGLTYFGPFASAGFVNQTLTELQKIFQVRPCTDSYFESREKPCLQYQIKRCSAPCVNKISVENYKIGVQDAKNFLSGKSTDIQEKLIAEMEQLSVDLEYERAANIRDKIKVLTQIQAKNTFVHNSIRDADLIVGVQNNSHDFCVQVFFIRAGKNFGNRSYHFSKDWDISLSEVMQSFIGQFYQNHAPPKKIILNEKIDEIDVLQSALNKLSDSKVEVLVPSRGSVKDLIDFAVENTKEELSKKEKERIKNENNLSAIAELFGVKKEIKRIEVYDNSHTFGTDQVGCMVVVNKDGFDKSQYRKFNINSSDEHDDYGMMREVISRRIKNLTDENYPDIMLIDGGKGQLSVVEEILKSAKITDIKVVGIAKGPERNAGREKFFITGRNEFQLPKGDTTLLFLQFMRNEVHRFAIETHRAKRAKRITKSGIDTIPGIGKKRKKDLLTFFGSFEAIKNADGKDLAKVNGISATLAKHIKDFIA